jgi:endonuclease/exonuclease/phosphatase family metal-dependent hydrolase
MEYRLNGPYHLVGSIETHCGFTQLYIRASAQIELIAARVRGPAVCAHVRINGVMLGLASVHLAPFAENREQRIIELTRVLKWCGRERTVIAGDANMRNPEGLRFTFVESAVDVHESLNRGRPFMWNSYVNIFYRENTQITCNFDRVFAVGAVIPLSCTVRCNTPASASAHHFLSDHFGMKCEFRLA